MMNAVALATSNAAPHHSAHFEKRALVLHPAWMFCRYDRRDDTLQQDQITWVPGWPQMPRFLAQMPGT